MQLFGFAAQHFLFPTLPERLLLILIGGQLLLPARQLGELLQRFVDLLRPAVGSRLLAGFVLVLFAVELEIGEIFQIAARAARSTASALRPECNLDIAEGSLGALGLLQSLLFGRHGIVPFLAANLLRRIDHALRRVGHFLGVRLELRIGVGQFASLHTVGQRFGLRGQLLFLLGQELGIVGSDGRVLGTVFVFVPGSRDDIFLALRDLLIGIAAAHAARASAGLRLRIIAFEGLGLDEVNIGLGGVASVLRFGVEADQIAGREFVIFQRENIFAAGCFDAFLRQQLHGLFRSAVDGVMQRHFVQGKIVVGIDGDGDFFDRIDLRVAAGTVYLHRRRGILARFDEKVFAQPDVLAAIDGRDVIEPVFIERDVARDPVPCSLLAVRRFQLDLLVVTQHQDAFVQRPIGENGNFGVGAFDGAQIAAGIFGGILHSGPGREMIGDADLFHDWKIDDAQIIVLRIHRAGFDVIFNVVGQAAEQELVGGGARCRQHVHLLPLRSAAVLREQPDLGRIESQELRGD